MSYTFNDIKNIVEPYLDDILHTHDNGKTIINILDTYSSDVAIIKYGWIHTNVFFTLRQNVS